jgi:hypothetical protein
VALGEAAMNGECDLVVLNVDIKILLFILLESLFNFVKYL